MNPANVEEMVKRLPFMPFEVRTDDGRAYVVNHSEQVWLTPRRTLMMIADMESDRVHILDTDHISALELLRNR